MSHLLIIDGCCIRTRSSSHPGPTIRHILDTLISRDMNEGGEAQAADNLHGFTPPRNSGLIPNRSRKSFWYLLNCAAHGHQSSH